MRDSNVVDFPGCTIPPPPRSMPHASAAIAMVAVPAAALKCATDALEWLQRADLDDGPRSRLALGAAVVALRRLSDSAEAVLDGD